MQPLPAPKTPLKNSKIQKITKIIKIRKSDFSDFSAWGRPIWTLWLLLLRGHSPASVDAARVKRTHYMQYKTQKQRQSFKHDLDVNLNYGSEPRKVHSPEWAVDARHNLEIADGTGERSTLLWTQTSGVLSQPLARLCSCSDRTCGTGSPTCVHGNVRDDLESRSRTSVCPVPACPSRTFNANRHGSYSRIRAMCPAQVCKTIQDDVVPSGCSDECPQVADACIPPREE